MWAAGAGVRIIAPTGAPDITSGKWQAMPIIGARAMLPELSEGSFFTALLRYEAHLPVISDFSVFADAGALFSYGPSEPGAPRRMAYYVDHILERGQASRFADRTAD